MQARTVRCIDKTNLAHAARQHFGHSDVVCEPHNTVWQSLRRAIARQQGPAGFAVCINLWRAQIIGQRRTKRLFIATLHTQKIKHLPAFGSIALNKLGQCAHLGAQRIGLAFGFRPQRARIAFACLRISAGTFGLDQRLVSGFGSGDRRFLSFTRCCKISLSLLQGSGRFRHSSLGTRGLTFAFGERGPVVIQQALGRLVPRGKPCNIFGQLRKISFALLQNTCRFARCYLSLFQTRIMAFTCFANLARLPFEPLNRFASVFVQTAFTVHVMAELFDPAAQSLDHLKRALLLIFQRIALHLQALQNSCGDRLFFAQGWQSVFGFGAPFGRIAGGFLGLCCRCRALAQLICCGQHRLVGLFPAAEQQHAFCFAQFVTNFAVTCGLSGLTCQLRQLRGQLFDHIINPRQVCLCTFEFQFGFMPALIETRDPCRLFQNTAARLWLGVDQLGNLALSDQGWRMRPG